MATSFTETATLRVVDESSAAIKKINEALKALQKTAKGLKSQTITIKAQAQATEKLAKAPKQLAKNLDAAGKAQTYLSKQTKELQRATEKAQKKEQQALKQKVAAETKAATERKRTATAEVKAKATAQAKEEHATKQQMKTAEMAQAKQERLVKQQMQMAERAGRQREQFQAKEEKAHLKSLEKKQREGEKAAAKQIRDADKTAKAQAQAATRAQGEIDKAARTANTERVRQERVDARVRRDAEREAARPTVLGRVGRGAGRLVRGVAAGAVGLTGYGTTLTGTGAALGRQIQEGTIGADVGNTMLQLKQLNRLMTESGQVPLGWREDLANAAIDEVSKAQGGRPGGALATRGQIASIFSEMLGTTREGALTRGAYDAAYRDEMAKTNDKVLARAAGEKSARVASESAMKSTAFLSDQIIELANMQFKMGTPWERAIENAYKFGKAAESQDWLTTGGVFDKTKAQETFDFYRQLQASVGRELTGDFFRNLTKHERQGRFTLGKQGVATVVFLGEEMGTAAAVAINQMQTQLGGYSRTKAAAAAQAELGLSTPIYGAPIKRGPNKGKRPITGFTRTPEQEAMQRRLLENPIDFIMQDLHPLWKKQWLASKGGMEKTVGKSADEIEKIWQTQLQDSVYLYNQWSKIVSDRTARAAGVELSKRGPELQAQWLDFLSRSGDIGDIRSLTRYSVRGAAQALQSQFQSVLGESLVALAPQFVPHLNKITEAMRESSADIAIWGKGGEAGEEAGQRVKEKFKELFTPGGLGFAGTAIGGSWLMTQLAPQLGMGAGLLGAATAPNEAMRSLGLAGFSLNSAASALKEAAAALGYTAGLTGGEAAMMALKRLPYGIGPMIALIESLHNATKDIVFEPLSEEDKVRTEAWKKTHWELQKAIRDRDEAEDQFLRGGGEKGQKPAAKKRMEQERAALQKRIDDLMVEHARLRIPGEVPRTPEHPYGKPGGGRTPEMLTTLKPPDEPFPVTVVDPRNRPIVVPPGPPKWTRTPEILVPTTTPDTRLEPKDQPTWISDFQRAIAPIIDVPAAFNSAFSEGSSTLLTAGTDAGTNLGSTASSGLLGGAGAAGDALAARAVAGIQAGISNINITANVKVDGAPNKPGTMKEA